MNKRTSIIIIYFLLFYLSPSIALESTIFRTLEEVKSGFLDETNFVPVDQSVIHEESGQISIVLNNGDEFLLLSKTENQSSTVSAGTSESDIVDIPFGSASDLRGQISVIKNQGTRGTCVSFAIAAAIESCISNQLDLSEQHIYFLNIVDQKHFYEDGLNTRTAVDESLNFQYSQERFWPYNPESSCNSYNFTCSETIHQGIEDVQNGITYYSPSSEASSNAKYSINKYEKYATWMGEDQFLSSIKKELLLGHPAIFSVGVTTAFFNASDNGGYIYDLEKGVSVGGHAILVIGHVDDADIPGGGYFIIKNSWGESWGDHGIGYLSYRYALDHMWTAQSIVSSSDGEYIYSAGGIVGEDDPIEPDNPEAAMKIGIINSLGSYYLQIILSSEATVSAGIFNVKGVAIESFARGERFSATELRYPIPSDLLSGYYYVQVSANGKAKAISLIVN